MKTSHVDTLLQSVNTLYVQRVDKLLVSDGTWTIYDDRTAEAIVSKVAPPDLVSNSNRAAVFKRRRRADRWDLSRGRGPDLMDPLRRFEAAAEALRVLDIEETGLIVAEQVGKELRDLVVLHDRQTLRFAERRTFDILRSTFPGVCLAAEKEWHVAQNAPIVFHDFGDVVAILSSVVYTGNASRHIYPVAN